MSSKIKCIVFDVGGVLFSDSIEPVYDSLNRKTGMKLFVRTSRPHKNALLGRISEKERYILLEKKSGIPAERLRRMLAAEYLKIMKVNKNVISIKDRLGKSGYRTGIISNMTRMSLGINRKRKLFVGFSPVILSCEVGAMKPHRRIYRMFLKRAKVKPEECVFIDDREKNLTYPRKIGMKTVLFRNTARLERDLKKLGVKF